MKYQSLKSVLALYLILFVSTPILIISFFTLHIMEKNLKEEINDKNLLLAKSLSGEISAFLSEPRNTLVLIKESLEAKDLIVPENINSYLEAVTCNHPFFNMIQVLDSNGKVLYVAPFSPDYPGMNMSGQRFFQITSKTKQPYWSSVFISIHTGEPTLTVTQPFEGGMVVGYLSLAKLNEIIGRINLGPSSYACVVDQEGTVIAHSDKSMVYRQYNVRDLYPVRQGLLGLEGTYRFYGHNNENEILASVSNVHNTGWPVVVYHSVDDAFAPIRGARNILLMGTLVVLIFAIVMGLWNLGRVLRPLAELAARAKEIAGGNYDFKLKSARYEEFNELENNFRAMTEAIKVREDALRKNITKLRLAEETIKDTNKQLQNIFDNVNDVLFSFDVVSQKLLHISPACRKVYGMPPQAFYEDPFLWKKVIHTEDRQAFSENIRRLTLLGGKSVLDEFRIIRPDGEIIWAEARITPTLDTAGKLIRLDGVITDITSRKCSEEKIRYLSFHDKVTGLYNRAYFEEELKRLNSRRQLPLSVIMGDVNGLKLVNDVFGHMEGDRLLIKISEILKKSCREEDIVARWGGDEFAILLPVTTEKDAQKICERIIRTCNDSEEKPVRPSIALGVATKADMSQNLQDVLKEAEDRMYRNKLIESQNARSSIIASLKRTLQEKDRDLNGHGQRLQELAAKFGRALDLPDNLLDELALLALLHDIGKVAISDDILSRPDKLSMAEWEAIQKHPEIGYRIAQSSHELAHIAEAILSHHENWDGSGYPRGLQGEDIPLVARIISIVDAYVAMTTETVYRQKMSSKEALAEINKCAGGQFDPRLVEVFLKVMAGDFAGGNIK